MATKKAYDLTVKIGTYESNGETKGRYQTIGVMLEKDDGGRFIILEPWFNPAGVPHEPGKGIMVSLFEPKQEGDKAASPRGDIGYGTKPAGKQADDGFDIPF